MADEEGQREVRETPPRQSAMIKAARAPKANAPAGWQVALEMLAIVAIPLAVPTLILGLSRSAIDLLDISFGLVALATAAVTKSLAVKTPAWDFVGLLATVMTAICVGIAIATDSHRFVQRIVRIVAGEPGQIAGQSPELARLAREVAGVAPNPGQWAAVIACGLVLVTTTSYLILKKER